ncbi:MAG: hypothetical protein M3Y58_00295 [Chloroflexota bacterium]|nr:hypothetical protein [Chloroflexota bacterium]
MATTGLSKQGEKVMLREMTDVRRPGDAFETLRSLPRPVPPPWLRDRILAEMYRVEQRKRLLRIATRYGAVGLAVLLWGAGMVCLCWAIAH